MKLTTDWSFSEACFTNCRLKAFSLAPLVQSALSIRYTPQYKPPHKAMIFHPTVWLEKHELEWTSYHQSHKPVSHGVSKAFSFGKAKDTGTWKSFVWEKSRVCLFPAFVSLGISTIVSIFFRRLLCKTTVVSYVFIWNLTREIEARPARTDPLAHARRLTAVFHA